MRKRISIFTALASVLVTAWLSASAANATSVQVSGYRIGSTGEIVRDLLNPNIVRVTPRDVKLVFEQDRPVRFDAIPGSGYAVIGWQKFYSDPFVSRDNPITITTAEGDDSGGTAECRSVEVGYEKSTSWIYLVPVLQDLTEGRDDFMRVTPIGYRVGSSGGFAEFAESVVTVTPVDMQTATRDVPVVLTAHPDRDYNVVGWQKFYDYPPADSSSPYVEFGAGSETVSIYPEVGASWLYVAVVTRYNPVRTVRARLSSFGKGELTISPAKETYLKGEPLTLTVEPGEGYQLVRWSDGNADHVRNLVIDGDLDLVAYVEPKSSAVSFSAGAGATVDMARKRVSYDSAYGELANCARTGYSFAGWYTEADGGTKVEPATKVAITEPQTLFAHWIANTYEVTFDANGGTTSAASATVTYDSAYGTLPSPTRTGYAFDGWWTAATGGTKVEPATKVAITDAQTLFAHWAANEYSLTVDPNGGRYAGDVNEQTFAEKLRYDATNLNALAVATRDNYTLKGYYTSRDGGVKVYEADGRNAASDYWSAAWPNGVFRGTSNLKVYANWSATTNNVTFEKEGGTNGTDGVSVEYAATLPTIDVPARTGYDFEGYYTMRGGVGTKYYDAKGNGIRVWLSAETTVLYANWTPHGYRLQYDLGGGRAGTDAPSSAKVGTTFRVSAPTRTGHAFAGWNVTGAGADYAAAKWGAKSDAVATPVTNDTTVCFDATSEGVFFLDLGTAQDAAVTLKANWSANDYEVTFDANGGEEPSFASTNVTYGSTYGTLPTCARTGYALTGWYTSAEGGSKVEPTTKVTITEPQTLFAHWAANSYEVTFDANGGTTAATTVMVTYDQTYGRLPTPTRAGWTFAGWWTEQDGGEQVTETTKVAITGSQKLYAHWLPNEYSLTVDPNGGLYEGDENERTFAEKLRTGATNLNVIAVATRDNYTLKGYYTSRSGGVKVYGADGRNVVCDYWTADWPNGTFKGSSDLRVYANWAANTDNVMLEKEGGTNGTDAVSVKFDVMVPTIEVPARTGYDFEGYYTMKGGVGTKYYDANGNGLRAWISAGSTALYANWTPHTYRVQYDLGGGTAGIDAPSSAKVGTTFRVSAPTRTGHAFAGWNVTGAGADYTTAKWGVKNDAVATPVTNDTTVCFDAASEGVFFLDLGTAQDAAVTLKANWATSSYTVTFDANGGEEPSFTSTNVTYGSTYGTLPTCARTGHAFLGWYTAAEGGSLVEPTTKVEITEPQTLFAHWGAGMYEVVFDANGGTGLTSRVSQYFEVGVSQKLRINTFYYSGHVFVGWNQDPSAEEKQFSDEQSVSDLASVGETVTLYAVWRTEKVAYTVHFDKNADDATGEMTDQQFAGGEEKPLNGCNFKRTGWTFLGWSTDPNAVKATYQDREKVKDLTDQKELTLYAVWTRNPVYYIEYYREDAEDKEPWMRETVEQGKEYRVTTNRIERTGHDHSGWKNGGKSYGPGAKLSAQELRKMAGGEDDDTIVFEADMQPITYTIIYYKNDGTAKKFEDPAKYEYGKPHDLMNESLFGQVIGERDGYHFEGWFTNEVRIGESPLYANAQTVSNLTDKAGVVDLYAIWKEGDTSTPSDSQQSVEDELKKALGFDDNDPITVTADPTDCWESAGDNTINLTKDCTITFTVKGEKKAKIEIIGKSGKSATYFVNGDENGKSFKTADTWCDVPVNVTSDTSVAIQNAGQSSVIKSVRASWITDN